MYMREHNKHDNTIACCTDKFGRASRYQTVCTCVCITNVITQLHITQTSLTALPDIKTSAMDVSAMDAEADRDLALLKSHPNLGLLGSESNSGS